MNSYSSYLDEVNDAVAAFMQQPQQPVGLVEVEVLGSVGTVIRLPKSVVGRATCVTALHQTVPSRGRYGYMPPKVKPPL
jgi:hypothetical protein